jgi:nitrate reductase gamma subunit
MLSVHEVPLLLALLVGLLLGLATGALLRNRASGAAEASQSARGDALMGMLVLGAFAMGAFVAYVLLGRA